MAGYKKSSLELPETLALASSVHKAWGKKSACGEADTKAEESQ